MYLTYFVRLITFSISALLVTSVTFAAAPDNFVWTPHNAGISGSNIVGVAVSHETPTTVYALTSASGVYKSTNSGSSWAAANSGLPANKVVVASHLFGNLLTMDPEDADTLYANFGGRIYKTEDGGASWTLTSADIPICGLFHSIVGVAVDPTNSNHLFAGHIASGCAGGLYESFDGGGTWSKVLASGLGNDAWSIVVDPSNTDNLYIATLYGGFLRSTDGGAVWTTSNPPGSSSNGRAVAVHPTTTTRVFYGNENSFYVSDNSGVSWTEIPEVIGVVQDIVFAPSNGNIGYAVTASGVFKTTDGGVSWAEVGSHDAKNPKTVDVKTDDPNTVYMGSSSSGMFKSTNGGTTFTATNSGIPTSLYVSAIAIAPSDPTIYYTNIIGVGFFRSEDGGYTWTRQNDSVGAVSNSQFIIVSADDPDTLYAGTPESGPAIVYKSENAGVSWTPVFSGIAGSYTNAGGGDPLNGEHVLLADSVNLFLYRSTDGGASWATSTTLLPDNIINHIKFNPVDSDIVIAPTYEGVWKSDDNGAIWATSTTGIDLSGQGDWFDAVAFDPNNPDIVYAGNRTDKVYVSTDGGDTWTATAYDSINLVDAPNALFVSDSGTLFVFTYGGGVQSSTNGGDTWEAITTESPHSRDAVGIDPLNETRLFGGDFAQGFMIFENTIPVFSDSSFTMSDQNGGAVVVGDTLVFTVVVKNTGAAESTGTLVSLELPDSLAFVSGSAMIDESSVDDPTSTTTPEFSLGTLLRNESVEVSLEVLVVGPAGSVSRNAEVTSNEDVAGTETNSVSFSIQAAPLDAEDNDSGGGSSGGSSTSRKVSVTPATLLPTEGSAATIETVLVLLRELIKKLIALGGTPTPQMLALLESPTNNYTRDLELGMKGDDVRILQTFLIGQNKGPRAQALAQVGATGYFGPLTQAALAEYQAAVGITPAVGYFGSRTRAHVGNL